MKFDASGGYRFLDAYVMAAIVQLATHKFCEKFLTRKIDPTGRQYDQMTQAARSGKMNIIEGSARGGTSKETEMKLTDVARASLCELRGDYETWLMRQELVPWSLSHAEAKAVYSLRLDKPNYGDDVAHESCAHVLKQKQKFSVWLESDSAVMAANALMILISRTIHMLEKMLHAQGEAFVENGGFREKLSTERVAARAVKSNAPSCAVCGKPMHKRVARSGKNEGKSFWGCTGYPDCREVRQVE